MDDLVPWLHAQLDEDERIARAAAGEYGATWAVDERMESVHSDTGADVIDEPNSPAFFIAANDPAGVQRDIDAKREVLAWYERAWENRSAHPDDLASASAVLALLGAVERLALGYADRPGYREDWRP